MKLHKLRPAKGATHKEKRIGRGEASGKGGTSTKGKKVDKAVQVTKEKWHTKVARCQFSVVFQSVDLKISTVLNTKYSTWDRLINCQKNMASKNSHLENLYINRLDQPD